MKRFLIGSAAVVALLATSCTSEEPIASNDGLSTIRVSLPGANFGTRSFGDGTAANMLHYAVYDATTGDFISNGSQYFSADDLSTSVSLTLANGNSYKIAFFADKDGGAYSFDPREKKFTVDYSKLGDTYNQSDNDAFYKLYETGVIKGSISGDVQLTRPVAQINWGTTDLDNEYVNAPAVYGENAANLKTKVEVKGVYTEFDLLTGDVIGEAGTATFTYAARPQGESFPYNGDGNPIYLSMNYVLVPADQDLVEATLTPNNGVKDFEPVNLSNLPVQANCRTNIYGNLLTATGELTVTKYEDFDSPTNNVPYVKVSTAEDFLYQYETIGRGIIELTEDIALEKVATLSGSRSEVTILLNGHRLYRTFDYDDEEEETASSTLLCVANGAKLTISGNGWLGVEEDDDQDECYTLVKALGGATVIINGGTFYGGYAYDGKCPALDILDNSKLIINGGDFSVMNASRDYENQACDSSDGWHYIINTTSLDDAEATAKGNAEVYGGTFHGYNPAWGDAADANSASFLGQGATVSEDGTDSYSRTVYKVSK